MKPRSGPNLEIVENQYVALLARETRLIAEQNNLPDLLDTTSSDMPALAEALRQEKALFVTRLAT